MHWFVRIVWKYRINIYIYLPLEIKVDRSSQRPSLVSCAQRSFSNPFDQRRNMRINLLTPIWAPSALLFALGYGTGGAQAQAPPSIPDCTADPYDVPAGLATSATTAAQDWAQMMCQQKLAVGTPATNPPNVVSRLNDPTAPINAWPTVLTTPETSWRDAYVDTVLKWQWGGWTTYDDSNSHGTANVLCGPGNTTAEN